MPPTSGPSSVQPAKETPAIPEVQQFLVVRLSAPAQILETNFVFWKDYILLSVLHVKKELAILEIHQLLVIRLMA